jgi:lipoprotein-releasing system ATP-binding protein
MSEHLREEGADARVGNDAMNPEPILVKLHGVSKVFEETGHRIELFRELDLTLRRGDFVSIMGASGVGKSTLLHILGLLERPTAGEVWYAGEKVSQLSDRRISGIRNQGIGFVFQFHHLLPDLTVEENVLLPARIGGTYQEATRKRAAELLELVGLGSRKAHLPNELSGGERQRGALARALLNEPGLLLCDEPSGNLDAGNARQLHHLLTDLNQRLKVAILVVTHDSNLADLARLSLVLREGRLQVRQPPARDP